MDKTLGTIISTVGAMLVTVTPAYALDARSAALGGSAIANGAGVHGALENPSTLMRQHRQNQSLHIHFGFSTDIQDNAGYADNIEEEKDLPDDIETEIDQLTGRQLSCDITSPPETICLEDTARLAQLSSTVLDILNRVDGKPVNATAAVDFGVGYTTWSVPIALHYRMSVTGAAQTDVAAEDIDYVSTFATVLADDQLTADELATSVPLSISNDGQTLSVAQPEDVLQSDVRGSALVREQMGLSMATTVNLGGFDVDLGLTPKFSELSAASLQNKLNDRFDDSSDTFREQWEDNENVGSSFTFDFGMTTTLDFAPIRVAAVARNVITEEIKTKEDFVFKTTPQLIVGGAYSLGAATFSADLAVNKAKLDNLETQILAFGAELKYPWVGLRAGLSHDIARTDDATAISLGLSAGPIHIGGRLTDTQSAQGSVQLAFSF